MGRTPQRTCSVCDYKNHVRRIKCTSCGQVFLRKTIKEKAYTHASTKDKKTAQEAIKAARKATQAAKKADSKAARKAVQAAKKADSKAARKAVQAAKKADSKAARKAARAAQSTNKDIIDITTINLSEYEQLRIQNIERNNKFLAQLGIVNTSQKVCQRRKYQKKTYSTTLRRSKRLMKLYV